MSKTNINKEQIPKVTNKINQQDAQLIYHMITGEPLNIDNLYVYGSHTRPNPKDVRRKMDSLTTIIKSFGVKSCIVSNDYGSFRAIKGALEFERMRSSASGVIIPVYKKDQTEFVYALRLDCNKKIPETKIESNLLFFKEIYGFMLNSIYQFVGRKEFTRSVLIEMKSNDISKLSFESLSCQKKCDDYNPFDSFKISDEKSLGESFDLNDIVIHDKNNKNSSGKIVQPEIQPNYSHSGLISEKPEGASTKGELGSETEYDGDDEDEILVSDAGELGDEETEIKNPKTSGRGRLLNHFSKTTTVTNTTPKSTRQPNKRQKVEPIRDNDLEGESATHSQYDPSLLGVIQSFLESYSKQSQETFRHIREEVGHLASAIQFQQTIIASQSQSINQFLGAFGFGTPIVNNQNPASPPKGTFNVPKVLPVANLTKNEFDSSDYVFGGEDYIDSDLITSDLVCIPKNTCHIDLIKDFKIHTALIHSPRDSFALLCEHGKFYTIIFRTIDSTNKETFYYGPILSAHLIPQFYPHLNSANQCIGSNKPLKLDEEKMKQLLSKNINEFPYFSIEKNK